MRLGWVTLMSIYLSACAIVYYDGPFSAMAAASASSLASVCSRVAKAADLFGKYPINRHFVIIIHYQNFILYTGTDHTRRLSRDTPLAGFILSPTHQFTTRAASYLEGTRICFTTSIKRSFAFTYKCFVEFGGGTRNVPNEGQ